MVSRFFFCLFFCCWFSPFSFLLLLGKTIQTIRYTWFYKKICCLMEPVRLVIIGNESSWSRFVQIDFLLSLGHWILSLVEIFPRRSRSAVKSRILWGVVQNHNPINRLIFSNSKVMLFDPACLIGYVNLAKR